MTVEDSKGLTIGRLKDLIHYDPETGIFTRIAAKKRIALGVIKNAPMTDGHTRLRVDNHPYLSHRLAWFYVHGYWPSLIDHINGNPNDNRLCNLRDTDHSSNMQNRRAPHKNNKSGFMGVRKVSANRWDAHIVYDRKRLRLGIFKTPEEAHQAYLTAKRKLHPGCTI